MSRGNGGSEIVREQFSAGVHLGKMVMVFSLALVVGLWVYLAWILHADKEDAVRDVQGANSNLARVFEAHADRAIENADRMLLHIKRQRENDGANFNLAQYLRDAGMDKQPINIVAIADKDGGVIQSSRFASGVNVREQEFFHHHAKQDDGALHIGKPAQQNGSGKLLIPLTRRINFRDGSFAGTVGVALDPSYFSEIYSQIELGNGGVVTLLGRDGIVRARQSGLNLSAGQNVSGNDLLKRLVNASPHGSYIATSAIDGITRIFSYRAMQRYPLVILVGTAEDTALAGYLEHKTAYLLGGVIVSVLMLMFVLLTTNQIARQVKSNRQLTAAREALQRSETHFRAIFDHAAVGIGRTGREGRWIQSNARLREILGYSSEELHALTVWQVTDAEDLESTRQYLGKLRAGEGTPTPLEKRFVRKDGSRVWVELTVTPVPGNSAEASYSIGVVTDISARKAAEGEAAELRRDLEERVLRRTGELAEANQRLEAFSYSVSHDLRTPLRAISGFAQILGRRHCESLDEQGRHYMDNIVKASAQMGRLIEDLLNYSRLGRKQIRLERVELGGIVDDLVQHFAPRLVDLGATLRVAGQLPAVSGDPTLLTQIFLNLIDNALTYHRKGVAPLIEVSAHTGEDWLTVAVTDNGIGIAPEHFERIFGVFQRLHSEDEYSGTGIGLATVKQATELLGGEIRVESILGLGSTFYVSLRPAGETVKPPAREPRREMAGTNGPVVAG
jgi:PAS domain S-box-containing protein